MGGYNWSCDKSTCRKINILRYVDSQYMSTVYLSTVYFYTPPQICKGSDRKSDRPGHKIPTFEVLGHESLGHLTKAFLNMELISRPRGWDTMVPEGLAIRVNHHTSCVHDLILNDGGDSSFHVVEYIAQLKFQLSDQVRYIVQKKNLLNND